MPPNLIPPPLQDLDNEIINHHAGAWAAAPFAQTSVVADFSVPVSTGKSGPSLDRSFFLTLTESVVQTNNSRKNIHGLQESAVLEGEKLSLKACETVYVFKCVGKLEYKKPTFSDSGYEDDGK